MFYITINAIAENFPEVTKSLNMNKQFQIFSRMIFESSSKFIFKDYYIK